jgi:hypothetical protein
MDQIPELTREARGKGVSGERVKVVMADGLVDILHA